MGRGYEGDLERVIVGLGKVRRSRLRSIPHLSRDKAATKMGHPANDKRRTTFLARNDFSRNCCRIFDGV
jgi:hypothetical protein